MPRVEPVQSNAGIYTARKAAEFMLKKIELGEESLIPSYIAAIAAGIEGEINTAYIDHFHKHFGASYTKYIKPYLFMKIFDRLSQLPIILSSFRYCLNINNNHVKEILEIFELRNRVIHVKHMWHYADIYEDGFGNIVEIKYHQPDTPDPYRDHINGMPTIDQLKRYLEIFNIFIPKFSNIAKNINRKNFNPEGWFLPVQI